MDTIAITFPQVKINLPVEGLKFNTLEQAVFDITQRMGREVLENTLTDIDKHLQDTRPRGALINTGKRAKYFLTRLGDIRYTRTRYIDTATKKARYLLEEHLGIKKNQRISLIRAKIEMFIASISTYRGTQKDVELLTGYRRSHEAIRQSVIKEAQGIIAYEQQMINKAMRLEDKEEYPPSSDIAYMEADSSFIRLQRRHKRKSRTYRVKIKRRRRKCIEVKLGIGYTDKVKRYNTGRGASLKLKDKFTYAAIENGPTFMENLSLIAENRIKLSKAKAIIFGGDGGAYISAGIKDYFTGATYILSKFHLKRNIKRILFQRPDMQLKINNLIKKDQIDKALSTIKRMLIRSKDKKKKKSLNDLYVYIDQNRQGINPVRRIDDKTIRDQIKGSGAMESNVDKFIAHRFKNRGMSWSQTGALSLLKIKQTISNNEWDNWWSNQRDEKIELIEPIRQLSAQYFMRKGRSNRPSLIEATIPALSGRDHNARWVKAIRELQKIDYYKD
ncbi:MAG: hypothetical protein COV72_01705 [Candidatus Omnitrophica bacterium CG11_big_fil_rev_8_21_14_0_20_42_13]|uniref:Transposase n=2 Tax=Bacteria TaxID=2 RepID=A0A2M7X446_UNCKA|nr:MAG: hypothetical protein COV72_01705 [Candidatus Omnitrophica bacterium CG11_big_fil_rev_8_21_14_0_20_42_13]PJA40954.1 MAG: hypothetical protein CO179_00940 [candidate division WWE3 bacterium CG_4_9_14_3_um_filter_39_7]